jgi:hypothetical protein
VAAEAADRVAAEAADRVAAEAADRVAAEGLGVIDVGFSGGHDFAAQDSILKRRSPDYLPVRRRCFTSVSAGS